MELDKIGLVLVFIGIVLIIIEGVKHSENTKFSVIGFIGPIPFGFSNDILLFKITLIIALLVFLLSLYLWLR